MISSETEVTPEKEEAGENMQKEQEAIVLGEEKNHPVLSERMGGIELSSLSIPSSLLLFSESTDQKRKSRTVGVPASCVLLSKALVA